MPTMHKIMKEGFKNILPVRDVRVTKINNGYLISYYESPYEKVSKGDVTAPDAYKEVFVKTEAEAQQLKSKLENQGGDSRKFRPEPPSLQPSAVNLGTWWKEEVIFGCNVTEQLLS